MKKKIEISMQKDCLLVVVDGYKNQQGEAIKEYNSFSKKIWEDVPNTRIVVKRTFNSPDVYYHKKRGGEHFNYYTTEEDKTNYRKGWLLTSSTKVQKNGPWLFLDILEFGSNGVPGLVTSIGAPLEEFNGPYLYDEKSGLFVNDNGERKPINYKTYLLKER